MIQLREHQVAAIAALEKAVASGRRRNLVILPTGTGKTILGLGYSALRGRTLWCAHREELIEQPAQALQRGWPGRPFGIVKAHRDERNFDIVFGSVASVAQERRLALDWGEPFKLLVIDEAHHAAAATYERIIARFAPEGSDVEILGLTATPKRADKRGIDHIFGPKAVYRLSIAAAVEKGLLVPVEAERVVLPALDLGSIGSKGGDFDVEAAGAELLRAGAADAVAKVVAERAARRKTVIFTCTVDQARRTAEALCARGVAADWVSGARATGERREVLERHRRGDLRAVANCAVLTEGYDDPDLDCVVVARPTKSQSLYIQMAGRGLRPAEAKDVCLIIDLVGAHEVHGLQGVATLAGAHGDEKKIDADVEELSTAEEAAAAAGRETDALLKSFLAIATTQQGLADIGESRVPWVQARQDIWALDAGRESGTICLRELAPGIWTSEIVWNRAVTPLDLRSTEDDATAGPLSVMRDRAELWAEGRGSVWRREARWRQREASEKQLQALLKWRQIGADHDGRLSGGEAADMLTAAAVRATYYAAKVHMPVHARARGLLATLAERGVSLRLAPDGTLLARGAVPNGLQRQIRELKPELVKLVSGENAA